MEEQLSTPLMNRDWAHLARSLQRLAGHAPTGYPQWKPWALSVADAVDDKDVGAVKAACKGCHDAYRDDYRQRMPSRPAPE
jgi:hypothetical protein